MFSNITRNSAVKNILVNSLFLLSFMIYLSLSSIYTILPPLLGILFTKYNKEFKNANFFGLFIVLIASLAFETEKSSLIGILFLLFVFLSFLVSKLSMILQESSPLFRLLYVFLPYIFYFFVLQSPAIFNDEKSISFSFMILWYLFCESALVLWKK